MFQGGENKKEKKKRDILKKSFLLMIG